MNGLKTLVLQDLTHVLPPNSLPVPSKLLTSSLHTAASSRRFWNFFEFANKDEVSRDSEQCQTSKDIVPPEQIAGGLGDIGKIPQIAPAVTSITSMPINPKMQGHQQQQDSPKNCWNASDPLKVDNFMSFLDGNSIPKTMKWKLKGYKTLRRHQTDEFAFVPGGIYDFDVDLLSDVHKVTKNEFAEASSCPARGAVAKSGEAREREIILSTKAIEAKDHSQVTRSETVQMKNTERTKLKEKKQKLASEDSTNADQPVDPPTEPASSSKIPAAQKLLSLPKAEQIKFLPISKSEVPTVSTKCQSQPTARYSSQPPDNSQKPVNKPRLAKTTANGRRLERKGVRRETSQPPDTYSAAPQQSARSKGTRKTETKPNVRQDPIEAEPAEAKDEAHYQPEQLEAEMEAVDVYENQMVNNRRDFAKATGAMTPKDDKPTDFAPGPWKNQRNDDGHTRFQPKPDPKGLKNVYETMGIPPKEGPPLKITGPDSKQQGRTSPCAATQAKLQQSSGNNSQRQRGSFSYDGGSSMAGNGGGSRKPPGPYPPFTSRRSSSSNSSALVRPLQGSSRTMMRGSANPRVTSSSISTTSRRPAPRKNDDDDEDQMIEGKTICTKPRENKCSRQRDDRQKKPKKQCKRYCCPALHESDDCPSMKGACGNMNDRKIEKWKIDPTCLPPESEAKEAKEGREGREICTTARQSCARRERNNNQACKQASKQTSPKQRCKREKRSSERRERSCERQEKREPDGERGGREICTKPRRRESCERRRDSGDRDCNRKATKSNGRRNYTQSAYTRRRHACKNINRFFSMTTMGFSLIGMNHKERKNSLFRMPSANRFFGKETTPRDTLKNCNTPAPTSETETKNLCQTSCGKSEKKESLCKTTSEADRCSKRRQQICKNTKVDTKVDTKSSEKETESAKERWERERKEIQECKKNISDRDKKKTVKEEKKASSGLERVISPCKQQSGKGSSGCGKTSCAAAMLNSLTKPHSSVFLNPDNDLTVNGVSDRLFSTVKFHQFDHYDVENTSDAPQNHYINVDDDVPADSGTITNIHQQSEDMENDSSTIANWFLTWYHS